MLYPYLPALDNIAARPPAKSTTKRTYTLTVLALLLGSAMLDHYEIAGQPKRGTNPTLQARYGDLVACGGHSLSEALAVGAVIEENDIHDLPAHLTPSTPAEVAQVYAQLLRASGSHLRSFVGQWKPQTGRVYQPQYLDAATCQAIRADDDVAAGAPRRPSWCQARPSRAIGALLSRSTPQGADFLRRRSQIIGGQH